MAIELPDPGDWLKTELTRRNMSQNELSQRIQKLYGGTSSSTISEFSKGRAGPKSTILIALGLNAPVDFVLALQGHYPAPPRMTDVRANTLMQKFRALEGDDALQDQLLDFATFLVERRVRNILQDDGDGRSS